MAKSILALTVFVSISLSGTTLATTDCPAQFHNLPLADNARYCQQFNDKMPATLSYFAPQSPQQVLAFYRAQFSDAQFSQSKDQQILEDPARHWVLVISNDGQGSQVDILVKQ